MREKQNPSKRLIMENSIRFGAIATLVSVLVSCAAMSRDPIHDLPKNVNSAALNTTDVGYPDLNKIPPPPSNLISDAQWSAQKDGLAAKQIAVENEPNARPITKQEGDMTWAQSAKQNMENEPRLAPAPAGENPLTWAARMRAFLFPNSTSTPTN